MSASECRHQWHVNGFNRRHVAFREIRVRSRAMMTNFSTLSAVLVVLALVFVGCANVKRTTPSPESPRGFIFAEQPLPGGGTMNYAVYVPRHHTGAAPMPCILFLHGRGESGTDGNKQLIQGLGSAVQWNAAEWPFVIILPQKPDTDQQWEAYEPEVMTILSRVKRRWSIDEDRVYLTGLSQGGHGTWTIAAANPGVFAAIAPICGYAKTVTPEAIARGIGDVPVWAFHGTADDVVLPSETVSVIEAIRAERAARQSSVEVKMSLFEGVNHGSWDRAYRECGLAQWLLLKKRGQR